MNKRFLSWAILSTLCLASAATAQNSADAVRMFEGTNPVASGDDASATRSQSDISNSLPTAMEMRQARAMYQAQQRIARLERNLWMGYEPLRPGWTSVPTMQSRYPARTIYIPVYYNGR